MTERCLSTPLPALGYGVVQRAHARAAGLVLAGRHTSFLPEGAFIGEARFGGRGAARASEREQAPSPADWDAGTVCGRFSAKATPEGGVHVSMRCALFPAFEAEVTLLPADVRELLRPRGRDGPRGSRAAWVPSARVTGCLCDLPAEEAPSKPRAALSVLEGGLVLTDALAPKTRIVAVLPEAALRALGLRDPWVAPLRQPPPDTPERPLSILTVLREVAGAAAPCPVAAASAAPCPLPSAPVGDRLPSPTLPPPTRPPAH